MKFPSFELKQAASLSEAFALLADPDSKPIAGGQSLLAALAFRLSSPPRLVDIGAVKELKGVSAAGDRLRIGALTTHTELGRNSMIGEKAPLLREASALIAHPAIRNRGTIGGSLAYADPASELPACMICLNADIVIASPKGERRISAVNFFTGLLSTALEDGELIAAVEVPVQTSNMRSAIVEIARRSGDYAMAGCAASVTFEGTSVGSARLVCFGVGDTAIFAEKASNSLQSKRLDAAAIEAASAALAGDIDPPADQHGTAETKRHLARVALERALRKIERPSA